MAELKVYNIDGEEVDSIELNDAVFGIEPNMSVLHESVVRHLANKRQGTQSTKTRTEVSGGGRKPFRQKGTGRARQGSIRSPIWRGGGIALGPKPRDYSKSMNRKAQKLAMKSALSSKVSDGDLIVVNEIALEDYRTKAVVNMLGALSAAGKTLIVTKEKNDFLVRSANNIPGISTALYNTFCVYDILNCNKFILTVDAIKQIEEVYTR